MSHDASLSRLAALLMASDRVPPRRSQLRLRLFSQTQPLCHCARKPLAGCLNQGKARHQPNNLCYAGHTELLVLARERGGCAESLDLANDHQTR